MQVSDSSNESVSEKSPRLAVPGDRKTSIPEASVQSSNPLTLKARTEDSEEENFSDAEDWVPVSSVKSKVKSKQSELSLRIVRFQTEIRPELQGTAKDWLKSRFLTTLIVTLPLPMT